MTKPITSKYDPTPLPETTDDGSTPTPSPDNGKDLSSLVPETHVAWDVPPSFNTDPKDLDGGGGDPKQITEPSGDLRIDLGALRTAEKAMLTEARAAVAKYEELRAKVEAVKGHVFGQGAQDPNDHSGYTSLAAGYDPQEGKTHDNPFAASGATFAAEMNPAQERALLQIGSTLERLGEYIALLNHSGQVYAETDRNSRFPDPPAAG
ncbi:hypothetical protein [Actinacidiphila alni]|uniref:Uncharacterized protein n=1 Tax=Actinacidiphila alni TaxID=380248 RepID=A0A1I2IV65_9ACTN|nr:hypothetical protein [Actinacidiphila alni]SFF46285.1 hypothetical protein SAMN05216251_11514 [Actinacidiphila alni]